MNRWIRAISYAFSILAILFAISAIFVGNKFWSNKLQKLQNKSDSLRAESETLQEENDLLQRKIDEAQSDIEECIVITAELPVYDTDNITKNVEMADNNLISKILYKGEHIICEKKTENGYSKVILDDAVGYVWRDAVIKASEYDTAMTDAKVVVIDPGHQGQADNDKELSGPKSKEMKARVANGTTGVTTKIRESVLTLDVSLKVGKLLKERGYVVVFVRRSEDVSISNRERAEVANDLKADAFIRIHADGGPEKNTGCHTICSTKDNPNSDKVPYASSKKLAGCILDSYLKATGLSALYQKPNERSDLSGINWCEVPVTILEVGFMTNEKEEQKLLDPAFQQKMAEGIADGVDAFFSENNE